MNDDEEIYSSRDEAITATVQALKEYVCAERVREATAAVCQGKPVCLLEGDAAFVSQQAGCQQCVRIVVNSAMRATISDPLKATN